MGLSPKATLTALIVGAGSIATLAATVYAALSQLQTAFPDPKFQALISQVAAVATATATVSLALASWGKSVLHLFDKSADASAPSTSAAITPQEKA